MSSHHREMKAIFFLLKAGSDLVGCHLTVFNDLAIMSEYADLGVLSRFYRADCEFTTLVGVDQALGVDDRAVELHSQVTGEIGAGLGAGGAADRLQIVQGVIALGA